MRRFLTIVLLVCFIFSLSNLARAEKRTRKLAVKKSSVEQQIREAKEAAFWKTHLREKRQYLLLLQVSDALRQRQRRTQRPDPNSHCKMMEDQVKKGERSACTSENCKCEPVWGDKAEGEDECQMVERTGCSNACCIRLCKCIHKPKEGCTMSECQKIRRLIDALVASGVLIENHRNHYVLNLKS